MIESGERCERCDRGATTESARERVFADTGILLSLPTVLLPTITMVYDEKKFSDKLAAIASCADAAEAAVKPISTGGCDAVQGLMDNDIASIKRQLAGAICKAKLEGGGTGFVYVPSQSATQHNTHDALKVKISTTGADNGSFFSSAKCKTSPGC